MKNEQRIAAEIDRDLSDAAAWKKMPPTTGKRRPLGTQISIRLDADDARRLRRVAHARGIGYTSLLRQWVQQRIRAEEAVLTTFTSQPAGYAITGPSTEVQVTSRDYTIRDFAIA